MFIDYATINVSSGSGGDGLIAFRREKYVPRGGPWGGDGGRGGDVIIRANASLSTLVSFRRQRHFRASDGAPGGRARKTGARGEDVVILVPPGTVIRDSDKNVLADLLAPGDQFRPAAGGHGGRGNARFATAVRQAPRVATPGRPGQSLTLTLELKLLADVGLVGCPNSGKSTLLAVVSRARPIVAAYPFSTLEPCLGVVRLSGNRDFVLADIPGLIDGAHQGRGLGDRFLRHVERTRVLVHLLDASVPGASERYHAIRAELQAYDPALLEKEEIIVATKADLPAAAAQFDVLREALPGRPLFFISALSRQGLGPLLEEIHRRLAAAREKEADHDGEP